MSISNHIGTIGVIIGGIDVLHGCVAVAVKPSSMHWDSHAGWVGVIEGNIYCSNIRKSSKEALFDANTMLKWYKSNCVKK